MARTRPPDGDEPASRVRAGARASLSSWPIVSVLSRPDFGVPVRAWSGWGGVSTMRSSYAHPIAARKARNPEVKQCTGEPIRAERRIGVRHGCDAHRISVHEPSRRHHRVTADVVQRTTAIVGHIANVGGVVIVVAERHMHMGHSAQCPTTYHGGRG